MKPIALLEAPSNLGLRPPAPSTVPGCAKAPGALRDAGLQRRVPARDAGHLVPPRYDRGDWHDGDGNFHAAEIASYTRALAARIDGMLDAGEFALVLGGDCTVMFGAGLALRRRGRYGLAYVDGHADFRHPGNADVGAAAGEGVAICTGRGQPELSDVDGIARMFDDGDVVVLGIRDYDEDIPELDTTEIVHRTVPAIRAAGAGATAAWTRERLTSTNGFWLHLDVDVLDPSIMPAVDSPDPGGVDAEELTELLAGLASAPECLGMNVSIYDPDLDPTGEHAATVVDVIAGALTR